MTCANPSKNRARPRYLSTAETGVTALSKSLGSPIGFEYCVLSFQINIVPFPRTTMELIRDRGQDMGEEAEQIEVVVGIKALPDSRTRTEMR